ncbi:MAG: hypothetical protein KBT02_05510 [Treponema sp.]|nr:hypothetical protein [Candidatus Treponema caballi]
MKKTLFTFLVMLMSIVCVFVLTGCPSPEDPAAPEDPATPDPAPYVRPEVTGKIGRYGTPYEVGDIVFTDGSATPAADIESRADVDSVTGTKLTVAEKNAIVAYIFYVGNELNNGNDTTTRTLGVGFEVFPYSNVWISFWVGVPDYSIDSLTCSVTGTSGAYSFSGIKNGRGKLDDAFNAYRAYSELLVEETKTKIEVMLPNVTTYLEEAINIATGNEDALTYLSNISGEDINEDKESFDAYVNASGPIDTDHLVSILGSISANFHEIYDAFLSAAGEFDIGSEESDLLYSYSTEVFDYCEELDSIHLFSIERNDFVAFVSAEEYGSAFSSYSDGWYLPTIAELYEVWKKKDDLCAIMGEEYDYEQVVSATQAADAGKCDLLNFSSGEISSGSKTSGNYYAAFAIREFPAE